MWRTKIASLIDPKIKPDHLYAALHDRQQLPQQPAPDHYIQRTKDVETNMPGVLSAICKYTRVH